MCTINFSQTLLANAESGANQERSSFALSEAMNGMAVVRYFSFFFIMSTQKSTTLGDYLHKHFFGFRYPPHARLLTLSLQTFLDQQILTPVRSSSNIFILS